MKILHGKGVSPGIAIGRLVFQNDSEPTIDPKQVSNVEAEIKRFQSAKALAAKQLSELSVSMEAKIGKENSLLFEIHRMMLEDLDYNESIITTIREQHVCAEYAVKQTSIKFAQTLLDTDDDYMRARAADVHDVSNRVIDILIGRRDRNMKSDDPVIFAGKDFTPSQTAQLERGKVLGLATSGGSKNSHTAIFSRTMGIPAVIGLGDDLTPDLSDKTVILDGFTGEILIDPDESQMDDYQKKYRKEMEGKHRLEALIGRENITIDGQAIKLFANIGSVEDVDLAIKNDAGGIGLFRSEFLYLQSDDYPSEDRQFEAYRAVLQKMGDHKVIIRTLDIGADKKVDYFGLAQEENPALGYRAIRICLSRPDVFKTQLRALFRASVYGNLSIMFPMIISVEEVHDALKIVNEVKQDLKDASVPYRDSTEIGIMIETPAAALVSEELAKIVDFFSIGTNDLTQYTLAIDRQNRMLDRFYNPHHPAILKLIEMSVESAHAEGKWVGICGELGADLKLVETFMKMGIDELSVSPPMILPLREKIRSLDLR
jgi:phosphotransferase system enzyme I (PtsI)